MLLKATQIIKQCGLQPPFLQPTTHNPCLFVGKPDVFHTIYLGLCVEFSPPNWECEITFEMKLKELTSVYFVGNVTHLFSIMIA